MLTFFASLILALGLALSGLLLFAKLRGVLNYWLRTFRSEECWVLGRILPKNASPVAIQAVLADANAAVRSHDLRTSRVFRMWDHERDELFIGVVLPEKIEGNLVKNFLVRHFPARQVLRLSGQNRADETAALPAAQNFALKNGLSPDFAKPMMLSGQSFQLYQWELPNDELDFQPSPWAKTLEWLAQIRDNLSLPILLTIISIGLLGMRDPLLFAIGIGLIVFLSGACKFVLIHQNRDEADELHLQNY